MPCANSHAQVSKVSGDVGPFCILRNFVLEFSEKKKNGGERAKEKNNHKKNRLDFRLSVSISLYYFAPVFFFQKNSKSILRNLEQRCNIASNNL